jgi:protein-tyrosine phosphatase
LTGIFGRKVAQFAWWQVKNDYGHLVASDAHAADRRSPILSAARRELVKRIGWEKAEILVQENPFRILEGKPVRLMNLGISSRRFGRIFNLGR